MDAYGDGAAVCFGAEAVETRYRIWNILSGIEPVAAADTPRNADACTF